VEPRITLITLGVADIRRAVRFYRDGLGWPVAFEEDGAVAFFDTAGTKFALYPLDALAADIGIAGGGGGFSGVTLAHNVRTKNEVADVLAQAGRAGGRIVKPAQDTFWGGHSGYFSDPDGHCWEVAWNPGFPLDADGFMSFNP
jgi:catechol 2,3-dioxygenase-like lactoylglutathione lyase family enzyme